MSTLTAMKRKWIVAIVSASIIFGGATLLSFNRAGWWRGSRGPGQISSEAWIEFSPQDGGFRMLMPGTPSRQRKMPLPWGGKAEVFQIDRDEFPARFYVFWYDIPNDMPRGAGSDRFLDDVCDGIAAEHQGKIRNKRVDQLEAHPGRRFLIESSEKARCRFHTIRVSLVGRRLIVAAVATPEDHIEGAHVSEFLNSLTLTR